MRDNPGATSWGYDKAVLAKDVYVAAWMGQFGGFLNILDTATLGKIDGIHNARNYLFDSTGVTGTWAESGSNFGAHVAVTAATSAGGLGILGYLGISAAGSTVVTTRMVAGFVAVSGLETASEYVGIRIFGTEKDIEDFNAFQVFTKHFVGNVASGGFFRGGGTGSMLGIVGRFLVRNTHETVTDTAYDVAILDKSLGTSLVVNAVSNVFGELAGTVIGKGLSRAANTNFGAKTGEIVVGWWDAVSRSGNGGKIVDYLSGLTRAQKVGTRQQVIDVLESGTDYSRELAAQLRAKTLHLEYANLPSNVAGRYIEGSNKILVNSKLVANGKIDELASTIVHESRQVIDDLAEKLSRFTLRRGEFRAFAQQLEFEFAIGRGRLFNAYREGGFTEVGRLIEYLYPGVR